MLKIPAFICLSARRFVVLPILSVIGADGQKNRCRDRRNMNGGVTPAMYVIGRCSLIQHFKKMGAPTGLGVQVLRMQKSLKRLWGTHLLIRFKDLKTRHIGGGSPFIAMQV